MSEPLQIVLVPMLKDNYAYLIHDNASGATAILDPSEAGPGLKAAEARGWTITYVLDTHHHNDHCGGNLGIKKATGAKVVGPAYDRERIPGIDIAVDEKSGLRFRRASCRGAVHPGPHQGTYRVPLSGFQGRLLRRHPVLDRLRPDVRGDARGDVAFAAEAAGSAGRHAGLLRP